MHLISKFLAATAIVALAVGVAQAASKTLKYAHFQSAALTSPKHAAGLAFEGCVEGKTSGSIDVQIFPASQLGNGGDQHRVTGNVHFNDTPVF